MKIKTHHKWFYTTRSVYFALLFNIGCSNLVPLYTKDKNVFEKSKIQAARILVRVEKLWFV